MKRKKRKTAITHPTSGCFVVTWSPREGAYTSWWRLARRSRYSRKYLSPSYITDSTNSAIHAPTRPERQQRDPPVLHTSQTARTMWYTLLPDLKDNREILQSFIHHRQQEQCDTRSYQTWKTTEKSSSPSYITDSKNNETHTPTRPERQQRNPQVLHTSQTARTMQHMLLSDMKDTREILKSFIHNSNNSILIDAPTKPETGKSNTHKSFTHHRQWEHCNTCP